ncbi:MAG: phage protein, partial [Solimonas sp.]
MSTPQFGRKASLIVGLDSGDAIDLSELRVVFSIRRGDLQTPNSGRFRVFNLAPDTARRVQKEFTRVVFQGGYEGNFGILFDGTIKQVRRGRASQTDTYLDITAADGDSAYNFAVVNTTLAAGSTPADHVAAACTAMNPY